MPVSAPRICGCGDKLASGAGCHCKAKRKREADAVRPSAAKRGYDAAWRRVRAMFLAKHPTCSKDGCDKAATDADHIKSIEERPDLRLSWSNLRPFCHAHHSQRTARDQGFAREGRGVGPNFGQGGRDRQGSIAHDRAELEFKSGA